MNTNIVDEATNTVMTENGPISLDDSQKPANAPKFKATVRPKKAKKPTKVSQILKLSEKGLTPLAISKALGVNLQYVYTARSQMKMKGVGRWHQTESKQQPTQLPKHIKVQEFVGRNPKFVKREDVLNFLANQGRAQKKVVDATFIKPYTPQPIIIEPAKPAPFFSRLKAAYAVLKGDVK